ncbi:unnamed protein product [Adineta steineri]|uniref:Uncharacterized protein n=1 Tax=Adineta steineri TaxID=433720 RepID=A0A815HZU9_9BILA|nr:unnamed protein product [Adineta steineri]CAF4001053.1 unnamed protein product [Adineta steineri]
MNVNNNQVLHNLTASLSGNTENESNINQLLFVQTIPTSQTPSISFNTINMIPRQTLTTTNTFQLSNRSRRRQARRRRRQRRRERREALRQQQTLQLNTQQRLQQRQYPNPSSQIHQEQYQRRQERQLQWQFERDRQWELKQNRRLQRQHRANCVNNRLYVCGECEGSMDDSYSEPLIEAYILETMDPQERWEQEQINELEKTLAVYPFEQLTFMQDELEQSKQIDHIERFKDEEEQFQLEQWEQHESIDIQDPSILAYILPMENDIEQLQQTNALQTMDNEMIREENQ